LDGMPSKSFLREENKKKYKHAMLFFFKHELKLETRLEKKNKKK